MFGDTPEATFQIATRLKSQGFQAAKFGWGPMGKFDEKYDINEMFSKDNEDNIYDNSQDINSLSSSVQTINSDYLISSDIEDMEDFLAGL